MVCSIISSFLFRPFASPSCTLPTLPSSLTVPQPTLDREQLRLSKKILLFFFSSYLLFLLSYPPLSSSHSACKPLSFSFKYMRVQLVGGAVFIVLLSYSSSHTYIFYNIFFIFNLFDCLLILQIRYHFCQAHSVRHGDKTGRVK